MLAEESRARSLGEFLLLVAVANDGERLPKTSVARLTGNEKRKPCVPRHRSPGSLAFSLETIVCPRVSPAKGGLHDSPQCFLAVISTQNSRSIRESMRSHFFRSGAA